MTEPMHTFDEEAPEDQVGRFKRALKAAERERDEAREALREILDERDRHQNRHEAANVSAIRICVAESPRRAGEGGR